MFRTPIHFDTSQDKINLNTPIISTGSCFANCIGGKLTENKFIASSNPFGITFNPISIFNQLQSSLELNPPEENSYVRNEGFYFNYNYHSDLRSPTKKDLEQKIFDRNQEVRTFLKKGKWLIITFGTAIVYERKENQALVANCHKVPAKHFEKKVLSQKQILAGFEALQQQLLHCRGLKVILTVSPVRHIKDSLQLNSVSKSTLRLACHTLEQEYENVHYFPAYEIMMDELRDYRFYKTDMLHPNEVAEDFIWTKFMDVYFDEPTKKFWEGWNKIKKAIAHKPFNPGSKNHLEFVEQTIERLKKFDGIVNIDNEMDQLYNMKVHGLTTNTK